MSIPGRNVNKSVGCRFDENTYKHTQYTLIFEFRLHTHQEEFPSPRGVVAGARAGLVACCHLAASARATARGARGGVQTVQQSSKRALLRHFVGDCTEDFLTLKLSNVTDGAQPRRSSFFVTVERKLE